MTELGLDPERVLAIAALLEKQAHGVDAVSFAVDRVVTQSRAAWQGPDSAAFLSSWNGPHRASLHTAAQALHELSAKARANALEQVRTSNDYSGGAGVVTGTSGGPSGSGGAGGPSTPGAPSTPGNVVAPSSAYQQLQQLLAHRIWFFPLTPDDQRALQDLLARYGTDPAFARAALDQLAQLPPAQINAVLSGLPPDTARAIVEADPRLAGNLDGVPLSLRADANQLVARSDLATAEANGDTSRVTLLKGLLDQGGSLVLYDPAHDHYGVLFGNPDAHHVAVLVPGVGNDGDIPSLVKRASTVQMAAGPDSAVIIWHGYTPPDSSFPNIVTSAIPDDAKSAARDLTSFSTGGLQLRPDQTLTIVGHSYGSLVTGEALAHDGLHPTNVVVAGSPGLGVQDVGGLHLNGGQFYAERAPGDPVATLLNGHGLDPTSPYFGGTRLATNADGLPQVSGHSDYFNANSQALKGIADVIDGNVSQSDVQAPTPGDYAGGLPQLDPTRGLRDDIASHLPPGLKQAAELDNSLLNGTEGVLGTASRNLTDGTIGLAKDVWDAF